MLLNIRINKNNLIYGVPTIIALLALIFCVRFSVVLSSLLIIFIVITSFVWGYYNVYSLIVLSLLMTERCGALLPLHFPFFSTEYQTIDLAVLFIIEFSIIILLKYGCKITKCDYKYFMILLITMILLSVIITNVIYDQNILIGLFTQRNMIIYLCYFPLVFALSVGILSSDTVKGIILKIAKYYITIYMIQYIIYLFTHKLFLFIGIGERIGIQYNYPILLIYIAYMILLEKYIAKKYTMKDIIMIVIILFIGIVLNQARMASFGLLAASCICLFIDKRSRIRTFLYIIPLILLLMLLFREPIYNLIIYTKNDIKGASGNSYTTRVMEKKFYDQNLSGHELFGLGVLNDGGQVNGNITGSSKSFYLNDLGSYEILYYYGYYGCIIFYLLLAMMIYKGIMQMKQNGNSVLNNFGIFILITSYTIPIFYNYSIAFMILLAICDSNYIKIQSNILHV